MNPGTPAPAHRWKCRLLVAGVAFALLQGCRSEATPPNDTEVRLKALGMLCGQFMARHRGGMPKDDAQLRAFAEEQSDTFLRQAGVEQLEELFGDQDGQPFSLLYGVEERPQDVVAYSAPDAKQRRYVVDSLGVVSHWKENEFRAHMGALAN